MHFQNTLDKYLEAVGEDQEQVIKTKKVHLFFMELFNNRYTTIIRNNASYLEQPETEIAVNIGNTLIQYAREVKDMTAEQAQN